MNKNINKLNVFISYSHKNVKYKEKLLNSLEALKQSYNIEAWHDGMIDAGGNIDDNVRTAMNKANIVLLLITDSFLASHYCMKIELDNAMKRQKEKKCIIIPVMFQETVLSDILSFAKLNRVPEDGKPIATSFKNQDQGCTHAVNMIKNMIDNNFPNCKKTLSMQIPKKHSKEIKTVVKNSKTESPVYLQLYEKGKLSNILVTQNMIDLIPKYYNSINNFKEMTDQALLIAKKRNSKIYKNNDKSVSESEKLEQLRYFLMDICSYTKTYITENVGVKVHFRVSKENYYLGLIASTDDDNTADLASDWTTKMTKIPMYKGLIYHSSRLNAPLIKSLNLKLNYKANNNDIWKDYITFTFPKIHAGQTPLISYCISIHKDCYKIKGDMLKILAYFNFGDIIEKYILDYINICKKFDKTYELSNIINALN